MGTNKTTDNAANLIPDKTGTVNPAPDAVPNASGGPSPVITAAPVIPPAPATPPTPPTPKKARKRAVPQPCPGCQVVSAKIRPRTRHWCGKTTGECLRATTPTTV